MAREVAPRGGQRGQPDPIREVFDWLCRAQDANRDGGVAGWYALTQGWEPSYPETTGYIIPTFLEVADKLEWEEARHRARAMADWEIEVQLSSGAVRSGTDPRSTHPAVFNTGQVLQGLVALHDREEGLDRHHQAALRAADWLCAQQDDDGAWRKNLSALIDAQVQTYNVRTAWALDQAGRAFHHEPYIAKASANADWTLSQQTASGWFNGTSFDDRPPLLHTLGYVIEGLLELGLATGRSDLMDSCERACWALVADYRQAGHLAGRYGDGWVRAGPSRCLTGEAQIAATWLKLEEVTGERRYRLAAQSVLTDILATVDFAGPPEVRGAVKGSEPLWGDYMRWRYPNWAAKFFLDGLLLARRSNASPTFPTGAALHRRVVEIVKPLVRPGLHRLREAWKKDEIQPVSREALSESLRAIGVREGRTLMVHASLDELHRHLPRLNAVEIIDLLLELVGESGTLVLPTFPFTGKQLDYVLGHRDFDVQRTPSKVGMLTEVFRRRRGVRRSRHPTHSVAAIGPNTERLLGRHHELSTFGAGSPFGELVELDGLIVGLGVGMMRGFTVFHTAEELHKDVGPILHSPGTFTFTVSDGEWQAEVGVRSMRGDLRRNLRDLERTLLERNLLRYERLGGLQISWGNARTFVDGVSRLLDEGLYRVE